MPAGFQPFFESDRLLTCRAAISLWGVVSKGWMQASVQNPDDPKMAGAQKEDFAWGQQPTGPQVFWSHTPIIAVVSDTACRPANGIGNYFGLYVNPCPSN